MRRATRLPRKLRGLSPYRHANRNRLTGTAERRRAGTARQVACFWKVCGKFRNRFRKTATAKASLLPSSSCSARRAVTRQAGRGRVQRPGAARAAARRASGLYVRRARRASSERNRARPSGEAERFPQNIEFAFADVAGTRCSTSQCSTILQSSSSRKMSMPAHSPSPGQCWRQWRTTN